jgi:hypothetical protein
MLPGVRLRPSSAGTPNLTGNSLADRSPHPVEPIQQSAVVAFLVPKIQDRQSDQRGHQSSHLVFPLPSALQQQRRASGEVTVFVGSVLYSLAAQSIIWSDQGPVECRPVQIFYPGAISDRLQIGVLQLVASPLPIACPFRIVALSRLACLRPTASHHCPSWSPWDCRESCWFA